jgi:REP element-mobilizing transposase RayT
MPRTPRSLPQVYSFHITLRCNSPQFLIAKGLPRDVLLAVLAKAQDKIPHRMYGACLMANHLHLLLKPEDAQRLPRLMHWIAGIQQWHSTVSQDVAGTSGKPGITPLPFTQKTTDEHSTASDIFTPTPKQQV